MNTAAPKNLATRVALNCDRLSFKKQPPFISTEITSITDSTPPQTSRVGNKLFFEDKTLAEAALKVERGHDVRIAVSDAGRAGTQTYNSGFTSKENQITITH